MLRYAGEHFWADFIAIMESKNEIRPIRSLKCFMGTRLSFDLPANAYMSAAKTRFALTDDHWFMLWRRAKNELVWDGFPLVPVARQ